MEKYMLFSYELCMKGDTFVHIKEITPIKCIIEE